MAQDSKAKKRIVKSESMRDKTVKASTKAAKPRRLKSTVKAVVKPFKSVKNVAKMEFYVFTPQEKGFKGFLTKKRSWTPNYFKSAFKEVKQVTWPSRNETWRLMISVFIFAFIFGLLITIVDFGLEKLFKGAFL